MELAPAAALLLKTRDRGLPSLWKVLSSAHFSDELPAVDIVLTHDVLPPGAWDGNSIRIPSAFLKLSDPDDTIRAVSFCMLHLGCRIRAAEIAAAASTQNRGVIFRMVATGVARRLGWSDVKAKDMDLWPFTNDPRLIADIGAAATHMLN